MKPKNNRIFCIGCHHSKMLFATQAKADNFIKFNSKDIAEHSSKVPSRSYYCSFCCGWHVTSIDDDNLAKQRDERDAKVWEVIKAKVGKRTVVSEMQTAMPPKCKKLPATTEGYHIQRMLLDIDNLSLKIINAMLRTKYEAAENLINDARILYEETLAKSAEYGIDCTIIDKRGDKLSSLEKDLCFVKSLVGNPEKRQEYLESAEMGKNKNRLPSMVESLHCRELIESLFVSAAEAAEKKDKEKVTELCAEIEDHLKHGVKALGVHQRGLYRQRMDKLIRQCGQYAEERADNFYRDLVLSIIELIEQAYNALQSSDFMSAEKYLSKAEDIMPDTDDENIRLLSNHISKLRSEAECRKHEAKSQCRILFLHGFTSSGECEIATTLRSEFEYSAEVVSPDLPLNPHAAMEMLLELCDSEVFDIIVGSSCGAFYAQQLVRFTGVPAILISPFFIMSEFLKPRIGIHDYKSPRKDGIQKFEITPELVSSFEEVEQHQFDCYDEFNRRRIWGMFGSMDTLAHFRPLFDKYYQVSFDFDGPHTMTADNVRNDLVTVIKQMLKNVHPLRDRYFRHFKGNEYRLYQKAKDSETQSRMIVYQALYGKKGFWVRPEKMFFERIIREGQEFPRFAEIEKKES